LHTFLSSPMRATCPAHLHPFSDFENSKCLIFVARTAYIFHALYGSHFFCHIKWHSVKADRLAYEGTYFLFLWLYNPLWTLASLTILPQLC
jgi:hypothetical protein